MADVKVPEVGESITEGLLVEWSAKDGDYIGADEPLFVLETDKITLTVDAEVAGNLKIRVEAGETVKIGQKVAEIDTKATAPAPPAEAEAEKPSPKEEDPPKEIPAGLPQARAKLEGTRDLSPAVRRLVQEKGLDPSNITGSGKGGRLTKEDVIQNLDQDRTAPAAAPSAPPKTQVVATPPASVPAETGPREERVRMSPMRQRIAERLIQAQQNAAILTTFNEIDMSQVIGLRTRLQDTFKAEYGVKLGFMSFFVKATIEALKAVPEVNARIEGDEIVYNRFFNIGVAVGTELGLVVPVIRDADRLDFAGIEKTIAALAEKAQNKKLELSDLQGGVFTISNGGIYGNMLSTPILNPPQSGILGMHAIKKRPVVINDAIAIRPMMYVALSYDHRLVDGREAVTFLKTIVECIENPEKLLLEF